MFLIFFFYFVVWLGCLFSFPFHQNQPKFDPWEISVFMYFVALASLYQFCMTYAFLHKFKM